LDSIDARRRAVTWGQTGVCTCLEAKLETAQAGSWEGGCRHHIKIFWLLQFQSARRDRCRWMLTCRTSITAHQLPTQPVNLCSLRIRHSYLTKQEEILMIHQNPLLLSLSPEPYGEQDLRVTGYRQYIELARFVYIQKIE
jgi:hypothetical protein